MAAKDSTWKEVYSHPVFKKKNWGTDTNEVISEVKKQE